MPDLFVFPNHLEQPLEDIFNPSRRTGATVLKNKVGMCAGIWGLGNQVEAWDALTVERTPDGLAAVKHIWFGGVNAGATGVSTFANYDLTPEGIKTRTTHTPLKTSPLSSNDPTDHHFVVSSLRQVREANPYTDLFTAQPSELLQRKLEIMKMHPHLFGPVVQEALKHLK